jgi:DNA polymerase III epsilon subunit
MWTLPPITVFDLETTGLDPRKGHRIIEIGGVRIENGTILSETAFVSLVNPERAIPWEAKQVNKISDDDVKQAPTIEKVLPDFLTFAEGSFLLAHNAEFDWSFLEIEKEYCWGYVELPECLCSMRLSQSLFPREFRHSLDVLCKKFAIEVPHLRHRALADAIITAHAFLKLLDAGKITSMEELKRRAGLRQLLGRKLSR